MPNPFDQFDETAEVTGQGGNPFDQFDEGDAAPAISGHPRPKTMADVPDLNDPGNPLHGQRHGGSFVTGIVDGLSRAITTPREVYDGTLDLNTQEGADRAFEMGMLASPARPAGLPRAPTRAVAPKATPNVAAAAQEVGVSVPRGIASESKAAQAAYHRGRQVPGATGIIDKSLDDFYRGVETKVDEVATAAAGGQVKDTAALGASVRTSLEKAIEKSEAVTDDAFKVMRRAIDPDKPVVIASEKVAKTLEGVKSLRTAAGEAEISPQLAAAFKILENPEGVTFNGLQRARSQVGKAIKWDASQGGFHAGDLKRVYGALTDAMDDAVRQTAKTSPEGAVRLWKAADTRFSKMAAENKVLASVLRKDADEGLVSSLVGMASAKAGNARKLEQVLREIGPESRSEVSGFVIQGLGKGRDGNFSPLAFSNNWEKLSPTGKAQLFQDPQLRRTLDNLAVITERMAQTQKKFANSSNTGGAVGLGAMGAGLVADPITTLATVAGANAVARLLSRPAVAKAAVDYAKAAQIHAARPSSATLAAVQKAQARLLELAEKGAALAVNDNSARAAVSGQQSVR
jgi:hypothetical protein